MIKRVYNWIIENSLVETGDTVVCAVSGGADSIVMLDILMKLRNKLGITVEAAHFNHHIRPENETNADEDFTNNFCKKIGVTCHIGSANIPERVAETGESVEEAARYLRYNFLETCVPGAKVATAHHADDNLETILMKLIRGCGTSGMCGIPPKRGNIIRPIMCLSRAEVEEYANANGLEYVTDSTNHSDDYFRNRVRHHIIPLMKAENPNVNINSVNISSLLRSDCEYLDNEADKALYSIKTDGGYNISTLRTLNKSIKSRVISKILIENNVSYTSGDMLSIENAINSTKGMVEVHLSGGNRGVISGGKLRFIQHNETNNDDETLKFGDVTYWGKYLFLARESNNIEYISKNPNRMMINTDKINGDITIRSTKNGDKIKLPGGTKSVGRLLKDKGVLPENRSGIPVICCNNKVIAVAGVAVDIDYRVEIGDNCIVINVLEGENG